MLKSKANTFPEETHVWENLLPFFVSRNKRPQGQLCIDSNVLACSGLSLDLQLSAVHLEHHLPASGTGSRCSAALCNFGLKQVVTLHQADASTAGTPPSKMHQPILFFVPICFLTVPFLMWFHRLTSLSHLQYVI